MKLSFFILSFLALTLLYSSCNSGSKEKCRIEGTIKNYKQNSSPINLLIIYPDNIQLLSKVKVDKDGTFGFDVQNKTQTLYAIARQKDFVYFVNDAPEIAIETDANEFDNYSVEGSVASAQAKELTTTYKKIATDLNLAESLLIKKMVLSGGKIKDKEAQDLEHKADKLTMRLKNYVKNFIDTANALLALNSAIYLSKEEDYYYLKMLSEKSGNLNVDSMLKISLDNLLLEQEAIIRNTVIETISGFDKSFKKTTINPKGKYTLLNFWSSWCYYSTEEQKYFSKVYEKYKDNPNFQFINLSIDSDLKKWSEYLDKSNLQAHYNIIDTAAWKASTMQDLGLNYLPACYLFDKEGKLITKNMRGREIEMALKEFISP